jgi:pimeloyl-ACP methyl ester carboxylesterase
MPETTTSADGTTIAYEKAGNGPALILVGGAMSTRQGGAPLVPLLADHFTVVTVDRRGRGDSSDTPPYEPAREVEDLRAVIEAVGGEAMVHGHSSGAILSLEAAAAGAPITRLSVYEPPYLTSAGKDETDDAFRARVQAALDRGDRGEAVELFIRNTGTPFDPAIKDAPWWPQMTAVAHTLPYDLTLVGDSSVPSERLARIRVKVLGMYGGASPEWAGNAIAAVTAAIRDAESRVLDGQTHAAAPDVVAPVLIDYFS